MSDSVPRELAEALLEMPSHGGQLRVGSAAKDVPIDLLPEGVVALGYSDMHQRSVTVFVHASLDAATMRERFTSAIVSGGFEAPMRQSGFGSPNHLYFRPYNRGTNSLNFSVESRSLGGSRLIVIMGPRAEPLTDMERFHSAMQDKGPVPQFSNPPGTRNIGGSGSGSGSFQHIRGALSPIIDLNVAVAHYDGELLALGWAKVGGHIDQHTGVMTYTIIDTKEKQWAGMFAISNQGERETMSVQFAITDFHEGSGSSSSANMRAV